MSKLKDIAKACNVSISTVSLAIHKPHRISREKKDEILRKAQELGYFSKNKTVTRVLIVFKDFFKCYMGDYYNSVIYGILEVLHKENITIQILSNFDVAYEQIYENNGIIFVGKVPPEFLASALNFKMPFVLCGHPDDQNKYPAVHFDVQKGLHELLDYLISSGHKKIGQIVGQASHEDFFYKTLVGTFQETMSHNQLSGAEKMITTCDYDNLQTVEIALNKLLKQNPTAICCADDHIAYISYNILKRWNIKIPDDISLTGFDDIRLSSFLEPPRPSLTTVSSDPINLGRTAVSQLKKMILSPNSSGQKHIILPVHLKIGASVKRIR
jgi:DNA-binding LacI/PurR family transcriptional regulator